MSKYLLNILLITLRDYSKGINGTVNKNKDVLEALSERYAYFKYIAVNK